MAQDEVSRGVLQGLLAGPLNRLSGVATDYVAALTKTIFDRIQEGCGAARSCSIA